MKTAYCHSCYETVKANSGQCPKCDKPLWEELCREHRRYKAFRQQTFENICKPELQEALLPFPE